MSGNYLVEELSGQGNVCRGIEAVQSENCLDAVLSK